MSNLSQKSIDHKVLAFIKKNGLIHRNDTIVLALSGGPDSICLFYVLLKLKDILNFKLLACHYNHMMRGEESYNDEEFVKKICRKEGIECIIGRQKAEEKLKNENEAREARYGFFKKILEEGRGVKVATAHTQNDLAETFLLRLVRGSGIKGLLSIPPLREKKFIRPLLSIKRSEVEKYLSENSISFRVDSSNKDIKITRNFLRLKVIPLLEQINPSVITTISSSVESITDDYLFLENESEKYFNKIAVVNENKVLIEREEWLKLHPAMRRMVLRRAISLVGELLDVTSKQLGEVTEVIEKGEGGKFKTLPHSLRVELSSGNIHIYRHKIQ